jgi:hypothetical protein
MNAVFLFPFDFNLLAIPYSFSRIPEQWQNDFRIQLIWYSLKKSRGFSDDDDDYYCLSLLLDFVKIISENDSWHSWFPQWYKVKICFVFWSLKIMFCLPRNSDVTRNFLRGYPPAEKILNSVNSHFSPVLLKQGCPGTRARWVRKFWIWWTLVRSKIQL